MAHQAIATTISGTMHIDEVRLSADEENAYRQHFLPADSRRIRVFCGLAMLFNGIYIAVDWAFVGAGLMFLMLLAVRLVIIGLSIATIWAAHRPATPRRHDLIVIGWGLSLSLLYLPVLYSRPHDFYTNLIPDMVIVFALHIGMSDNLKWRMLPGLAYTFTSLLGLFAFRNPLGSMELWSVLSSFFFANFVGIVFGRLYLLSRRKAWRSEQENIRLAQERAEMIEMKKRLISTISHEFRTPLNAIASSATLLGDYLDRMDDQQRSEVIERLNIGTLRLAELIDQAAQLNRENVSRPYRHLVSKHVDAWGQQMAQEIDALYPGYTVSLPACIACQGRQAWLDPFLLRLIVSNLVSNSVRHCPPDAHKSMELACDDVCMTITVTDEGPGIPADERERIFEEFFRGRNARETEGIGMGLAIVKESVELLEGSIEMTSRPGKTTFVVRLPWLGADDA